MANHIRPSNGIDAAPHEKYWRRVQSRRFHRHTPSNEGMLDSERGVARRRQRAWHCALARPASSYNHTGEPYSQQHPQRRRGPRSAVHGPNHTFAQWSWLEVDAADRHPTLGITPPRSTSIAQSPGAVSPSHFASCPILVPTKAADDTVALIVGLLLQSGRARIIKRCGQSSRGVDRKRLLFGLT